MARSDAAFINSQKWRLTRPRRTAIFSDGYQVDLLHDGDIRNRVTVHCNGGRVNMRGGASFAPIASRPTFSYAPADRFTVEYAFSFDPVGLPNEARTIAYFEATGGPIAPLFQDIADEFGIHYPDAPGATR